MAKATSPIRLQQNLMRAATLQGERQHRSAAEQIEYWASIGQSVANTINPDSLLAITSGLARLKIEPIWPPTINPDDVFSSLEVERKSGELAHNISENSVRYQVSNSVPSHLDQISANGTVKVGQFENGVFVPKN